MILRMLSKRFFSFILIIFVSVLNVYSDEIDKCIQYLEESPIGYGSGDRERPGVLLDYLRGNIEYQILFDSQKDNLEELTLKKIKSGDVKYIYLADYYGYTSAVNIIIDFFIDCGYFYGWELSDYSQVWAYTLDDQYLVQNLCIVVFEHLLGKNVRDGTLLTKEQYKKLYSEYNEHLPISKDGNVNAMHISSSLAAYWKLTKLGYNVELYK
ncbi:hypothetical protein FACS1894147_12370 [Spirochaetia bacterium]|nr:hypothetical protein FACS1894147_12370 [Spirochaetia bacterium]